MGEFLVRGLAGSTSDFGGVQAFASLWNPHSTRAILVLEVTGMMDESGGTGLNWLLRRITARGTPGSTITPDADNDRSMASAPPSGALLDLANYGANQPTFSSPDLKGLAPMSNNIGGGFLWPFPEGIELPALTGLCICSDDFYTSPPMFAFRFDD